MTEQEIIERKALLHRQAAELLRTEAKWHEKEAEELEDEASALLRERDAALK